METGFLNRIKEDRKFFYLCFYLVTLVIHFVLPLNWADDAIFFDKASQLTLSVFLNNSARPFVDSMTYFFARYPVIWRIVNPLMLTLLSALICKYTPCKNEKTKTFFVSAAILYPSMVMVDAGFIATTLNYLWPVTLGLLSLVSLWKLFNGIKIRWYEMLLLLPCLMYATNMQQMAVVLVVVFFGGCVYLAVKKKLHLYVLLQFIISLACLLYSYLLNTTGSDPRLVREMGRYFPNFIELNLFEKVQLGFSATFYCLTMELCFAWVGFFAFLILLLVAVFKKSKNKKRRALACVPVIFSIYGLIQFFVPEEYLLISQFVPGELKNYRMSKAVYSFEPLSDIFFVLILLCVFYLIWSLLYKKAFFLIPTVLVGLGTRMLMGFSPTVWASGHRTFYILFITLIVVGVYVVDNIHERDWPRTAAQEMQKQREQS